MLLSLAGYRVLYLKPYFCFRGVLPALVASKWRGALAAAARRLGRRRRALLVSYERHNLRFTALYNSSALFPTPL